MIWPLLLAQALPSIDTANQVAQGYEKYPVSYSLALAVAVIGVLGTVIVTLFWWGANGRASLHEQNFKREVDRNQDLKRDRERAVDDRDRIHTEHMRDLAKFLLAGESLAKLYDDLKAGRVPKPPKGPV